MQDLRRLWWLASYPKSGNTWARMFLNAYLTGFPVDINSAFQYVRGDLDPSLYQLTAAWPINDLAEPAPIYYRPAALMNLVLTSHTRHLCLKTHHARVECDGIPLCPARLSLGAVYLVRDPRDVAVSFAHHLGKTIDETVAIMAQPAQTIVKDSTSLYHILTTWAGHVDSWTIGNRHIPTTVIRYEDLVADPDAGFRRLLAGLGFAEIREDRLAFALEETDFARLRAKEEAGPFRENGRGDRFFRRGRAGGWRDVLTPDQVAAIEHTHRQTMLRHRYHPEACPASA